MNFLQSVQSSVYNPEFYSELVEKPFSYSLYYFFSLVLILAFIGTGILGTSLIPSLHSITENIDQKILATYPQNLIITIKDGIVSTNVQEPYSIVVPQELTSSKNFPQDIQNLIVIDTHAPFTLEAIKKHKTVALLTKDALIYRDENGAFKIKPVKEIPDTVISKATIQRYIEKARPFIKFIAPISVLMIFLGLIIFFSANLLYLVFGAGLIWIISKFKRAMLSYKKAYQIGLHAITLIMAAQALFFVFPVLTEHGTLWIYVLIFILVVFINFPKPKKVESSSVIQSQK